MTMNGEIFFMMASLHSYFLGIGFCAFWQEFFGKLEPRDWISIVAVIVSVLGWVFVFWKDERRAKKNAEREDIEKAGAAEEEKEKAANHIKLEVIRIPFFVGTKSFRSCFVDKKRLTAVVEPEDPKDPKEQERLVKVAEKSSRTELFDPEKHWSDAVQHIRCEITNTGTGVAHNIKLLGMDIMATREEVHEQKARRTIDKLDPQETIIVDLLVGGAAASGFDVYVSSPRDPDFLKVAEGSRFLANDVLTIIYTTQNNKEHKVKKTVYI